MISVHSSFMRHPYTLLLTSVLVLIILHVSGQSVRSPPSPVVPSLVADTTKPSYKFRDLPWYGRLMPLAIYTGAGKRADRIPQSIEIGKSYNVVDVGLAFGRSSLRPDSTYFLEGRVTMDVCNYGIFANEMTIGAGRLFDAQGSLMLELSYNIFAQVSPRWGFGLTTGYYDFSSELTDSSKTFYGLYFRYGLQRTDGGGLLGLGRGHGRPGRPGGHGHGR